MALTSRYCLIVLMALGVACSGARKSRVLDLAAVERGEIFTEWLEVEPGNFMMRVVAAVDAPRERVFTALSDVEALPLWDGSFKEIRILQEHPGLVDWEATMEGPPGISFTPPKMRSRFDRTRGEVTVTAYENDWLRSLTWVNKLDQLGENRTLMTIYARTDIKAWWGRLAVEQQEERLVMSVRNLRRVVKLNRWDAPPPATVEAPPAERLRVLVPAFTAAGLSPEVRNTLARVCAEQLMRRTVWSVITHQELAALLNYGQQKELMGCSSDAPCTVEVGKALDAERLVVGNVGKVGGEYILDLSLVSLPDGGIERRASARAPSDEALVGKMEEAVQLLVGADATRAGSASTLVVHP